MRLFYLAGSLLAACCASQAAAADFPADAPPVPAQAVQPTPTLTPFFVRVGVGGLFLNEGAHIFAAGNRFAGASVAAKPQFTPLIEAGYYFSPNWAASFAAGFPPLVKVTGVGNAQPLGTLGKAVYGPTTLTAHYHFTQFGAFRPYVGAGIVGMLVLRNEDAALTNLKLNPAFGLVAQVGIDYAISDHWSVYADVKKAYLRSTAKGYLGLVPTKSKVALDPLVLSTGIGYRF